MTKFTKGFTLIELLVVIAIIGVLSSVVLASLNTARAKGANAAIKANLNNMRSQSVIYYDTNNNYTALCADSNISRALTAAAGAGGGSVLAANSAMTAGNVVCYNAATTWVVEATLKAAEGGNNYWCVDNTGVSKAINSLTGANATVCPAS